MPIPNGQNEDHPGVHGLAYLSQLPALELCRDLYSGTFRMREMGTKYLPRFEMESKEDYAARKSEAVLYNAFRRSVRGLTGMVFRKDPVLSEDVTDQISEHAENIDLAGRHLSVFARDCFEDKMVAGHVGIFVDWHAAGDARNRAEEEALEARPYWVLIRKDQIIRHRVEVRDGRMVLVSFAYMETDTEQVGEYGEREILRVRQYDLEGTAVNYRSWTRAADEEDWKPEEAGRPIAEDPSRMPRIPLVIDYADRTGYLTSNPPLEDLAHINRRHYSLTSDRDSLLHTSHVPIFTVIGEPREKLEKMKVGANTALVLENPEADAKYLEASGEALQQSADEVERLEKRMAHLGLSMLQSDTRAAETAASKRIDKTESDSQLAAMARATQDALEEALKLHAMWLGESESGSIEVNRDFEAQTLDAHAIKELAALVPSVISLETLWDLLVQGEVLPDGFDPDLERERVEQADAEQLMALRTVARMQGPPDDEDEAAGTPAGAA